MTLIAKKPAKLQLGDTIAIAPLAGPWQEEVYNEGIAILKEYGFDIKILTGPQCPEPFLATDDKSRLEIFTELWQDKNVKAIIAARGGYGCLRFLDQLDFELLAANPKILIGFSDISGLLNVISQQAKIITYHGPNLTTISKVSKDSQQSLITTITSDNPEDIKPKNLEIINNGTVTAPLVGGNLATIIHLSGTKFQLDCAGKILFIEDVGEAPYRIDRLLTQLKLTGQLEQLKGLILGQFTSCGHQEDIWHRLTELLDRTSPYWANFPVGHGFENYCLPIGSQVTMDANKGILSMAS